MRTPRSSGGLFRSQQHERCHTKQPRQSFVPHSAQPSWSYRQMHTKARASAVHSVQSCAGGSRQETCKHQWHSQFSAVRCAPRPHRCTTQTCTHTTKAHAHTPVHRAIYLLKHTLARWLTPHRVKLQVIIEGVISTIGLGSNSTSSASRWRINQASTVF